jgi:hypothetical protein
MWFKPRATILGRAEYAGPGELHGAITHATNAAVAKRERCGDGAGLADAGHDRSPLKTMQSWALPARAISRYNPHKLCGFMNNESRSE